MRFSLLFMAYALLGSVTFADDQPITTEELARHLGISTWRIPKEKLPDAYTVTLYHVKNGTLTREYMVGNFKKHDALLICTRWLSESVSVTADDGEIMIATKVVLPSRPIFTSADQFAKIGIPLLLCMADPNAAKISDRHQVSNGVSTTIDYTKVESGLAILVDVTKP